MRIADRTRRRWALAGLIAYAATAGLVLLLPVSYSAIVNAIGDWLATELGLDWFGSGWVEFVGNIILFAPLGALLTLLIGRLWPSVSTAVLFSAGVELIQFLVPLREPTLRDVLSNSIGALLGAGVGWALTRAWSSQALDEAFSQTDRIADTASSGDDRGH